MQTSSSAVVFKNVALLDVRKGQLRQGCEVVVRGGRIEAVEAGSLSATDAIVVNGQGRTLMPGLIDCHVHLHRQFLPTAPTMLPSMIHAWAGVTLRQMLLAGFTTVRDAAGADAGLRDAVQLGLFNGPRVFVSGRAISQTGGHGDYRSSADMTEPCNCIGTQHGSGRVADGVDEVRKAIRDELRLGADQIKIMAGGGVASQSDPIDQLQYSMDELRAAVDECARSHTYVMAHVYTAPGILRCVEAGVRTIEHGNLLDEAAAASMAGAGAYLVPNLIAYKNFKERGRQMGYNDIVMGKLDRILEAGPRSIDIAKRAGVKIGFGSDLASVPDRQSEEFVVRGANEPAIDIIRSATLIGAEIVRQPNRIGEISAGAVADILLVDGNPLEDISLLSGQGAHLALIMKHGKIYNSTLETSAISGAAAARHLFVAAGPAAERIPF